MLEEFEEDSENFNRPPSFFPYNGSEQMPESKTGNREPVEVTIEGIFAAESNGNIHRFVLLTDGERKVSILIGPFEAQAITMPLEGAQPDRPMTHDLIKTVLDKFNGAITKILIDDLWSTTYYAKIFIQCQKEEIIIDSRPSDAIALAVRYNAPIYVSDNILEQNNTE